MTSSTSRQQGGSGGGGGGGGGGKGGAIKKLHEQLENGELGDTTHMELETLLVSYQRSVLTDALFSRGYRAKNMHVREKIEHQRTVDALYDSYVHDQLVQKKKEARSRKLEAKRLRKLKKMGISPAAAAAVEAAEIAETAEVMVPASETSAGEPEESKQGHHPHNHKTHVFVPKGGRIKPSASIQEINTRLMAASSHIHKLGDLRDYYR